MPHYNLIIIGGGVVGLTLANLLADSGLSIALIDHQSPPQSGLKNPYDSRVSAINHASKALFQSLGVWQALQDLRVARYQHMSVWDAGSPAKIEFDGKEIAQPDLGFIIEQTVMRQVLWQQLSKHVHIKLYPSTQPTALTEQSSGVHLQLSDGQTLTANLLVGADGGNSWVAKQARLSHTTKTTTEESAVVTTIKTEHSHQNTAWQRFLTTGPVALLPLAEPHLVSLVWSTTTQHATQLNTLSDTEFNRVLTQATENRLGKLSVCDQRSVLPLFRHHAKHYVTANIALVGDAAHTILPLAGQGVNLGLLDAACLAQVIQEALNAKRDFSAVYTLRRYERWRRGENAAMLLAMEAFNKTFRNPSEPARYLRYLSFALTQKLPFIKKHFMQRAAGLRGDLPTRILQNYGIDFLPAKD